MQIYLTINNINLKMYIGKDSKSDPNYLGSGSYLNRAILKYGSENFSKIILKDNIDSLEELCKWEKHFIDFFKADTNKAFYNISSGGEGGDNFTNHPNKENIREKCRLASLGRAYSYETIEKMSESQKKPIYKFDKEGNLLCRYESIEEAAIDNNIKNKGNICTVANGIRNYAGNYRWSYTSKPMDLTNNKVGRKKGTKNSYKVKRKHSNYTTFEVFIYDEEMVLLQVVKGYEEAADLLNLSKQMINKKCLNGEFYKGYFFKKGKTIKETKNIKRKD